MLLEQGLIPPPRPEPKKQGHQVFELLDALAKLKGLEGAAPALHDRALVDIETANKEYAALQNDVKYWVQQLVKKGAFATTSTSGKHVQAGVELSEKLYAMSKPGAASDYVPKLLKGSLAEQLNHLLAYHAELCMANRIADHLDQYVVEYGDEIGVTGADTTSVGHDGSVYLYDSKVRTGGERNVNSPTFTEESARVKAVKLAHDAVSRMTGPGYTEAMRSAARQNLKDGNFTTYTVTSQDATTFHTCVEMKFVNHKVVSIKEVPVPWGAGI
jgi:hypothetical protein